MYAQRGDTTSRRRPPNEISVKYIVWNLHRIFNVRLTVASRNNNSTIRYAKCPDGGRGRAWSRDADLLRTRPSRKTNISKNINYSFERLYTREQCTVYIRAPNVCLLWKIGLNRPLPPTDSTLFVSPGIFSRPGLIKSSSATLLRAVMQNGA